MKITYLQRGPASWRLRIETRDAAGERAFRYETVRGTEADAQRRREEILAQHAPKPVEAPRQGAPLPGDLTLAQAFDLYVKEKRAFGIISDSSEAQYTFCATHYLGDLAHRRLAEISTQDVHTHFVQLAPRLGPRSLKNVRQRLSSVFNHCIAKIPAGAPALPHPVKAVKLAKVSKSAGKVLSPAELERVLEAARASTHVVGLVVRFAIATGMRRGEICGLRWQDVDLDRSCVYVRAQVHLEKDDDGRLQPVLSETLKTEAARRTIGLPPSLVEDLRALLAEKRRLADLAKKPVGELQVFTNAIGRAYTPGALTEAVGAFLKRLGLDISLHDLRHVHATLLLNARHNPKAVSVRLGHADVQTTLSVYAHALPSDDENLTAEAGNILGGK